MKKIAVITRDEEQCGIFGYTISALRILQTSTEYEYELHRCSLPFKQGHQVYIDWLESIKADAFLYNFCPITMPWLLPPVMAAVKRPHFVISGHDIIWFDATDWATLIKDRTTPNHVWSVDPTWEGWFGVNTGTEQIALSARRFTDNDIVYESPNYSTLPRPVITYPELSYTPPGDVVRVGTFGLSSTWKNYDKIVERVCRDFPDQPVHLIIRATQGKWEGHDNSMGNNQAEAAKKLATSNVTVEITYEFLPSQQDLATWLNTLDLILFIYEPNWNRYAVSSSLDHALAARKPIALNDSKMFSHARHIPEIYIEQNSLKDIMERGIEPLLPLYEKYSYNSFIEEVESKIRKFI